MTGLAINPGNPEAVVFFLALLPTPVRLDALTPGSFAAVTATIPAIIFGVFGTYALLAAQARRLLQCSIGIARIGAFARTR